jgi:hypothetical protein
MTLTIIIPEHLVDQLQRQAEEQQIPAETMAIELLEKALEEKFWPTVEEVVAKIKATPPDPNAIRPAEGSLADALRSLTPNPEFNLAEWERQWAAVEAEMKQITHTNDIAEGRG